MRATFFAAAVLPALLLSACAGARAPPVHLSSLQTPPERQRSPSVDQVGPFLAQVKAKLFVFWSRRMRDEARVEDPNGQLYSQIERKVTVDFAVDRQGNVLGARVSSSSGVDYMDRVAVESFALAEKFDEPPLDLFEGHETVSLPFTFTVQAARKITKSF